MLASMMHLLSWCDEHKALVACGVLFSYTVWTSMLLGRMWTLRRVPGSRGPMPVLGLLLECIKHDFSMVMHNLATGKYAEKPIFQAWGCSEHYVVVNSVELGRRLEFRYNARSDMTKFGLRFGEDQAIWNSGLLFIHGSEWRTARKAFEAAVMHPRALAAQAPFICQVLSRKVSRLAAVADSGQPVDMLAAMYDCSIDAIGWAALGIDLQATSRSPSSSAVPYEEGWWAKYPVGSQEFGALMLQCAIGVMKSMDLSRSSSYYILSTLLPGWKWPIRCLARLFPDDRLKNNIKNFAGLREAIRVLLATWRQQQQQQQDSSPAGIANGTGRQPNGAAVPIPLVSEQSFVARLLSGRDLAADEVLQDHQVIGQVMMMVVAGYETTGAAVANTLYLLAKNPAAQRRAQEELDAVLQGKAPTFHNLEQLPYLSAVFSETLRLQPSAAGTVRQVADEQLEVAPGIIVPKGATLYFSHITYMRDPAIWPRAEEFLPERHIQPGNEHLAPSNPTAYMPFGHGARMCVGYKYAQMEARLALAHLLQRFTFEIVPGEPEPRWQTSLAFTPNKVMLNIKSRV